MGNRRTKRVLCMGNNAYPKIPPCEFSRRYPTDFRHCGSEIYSRGLNYSMHRNEQDDGMKPEFNRDGSDQRMRISKLSGDFVETSKSQERGVAVEK
ncbi:unnamed protein product [Danaus chrysippus]|uniref:(African queen) hypothetical protein n=1 Tax=Danaus chrysippus TaxID=151541 RepID=A0A8J2QXR8_9NEOP|nr:unnamed protein product [Danaus chrysippus]